MSAWGPTPTEGGRAAFRLWAPDRDMVTLEIDGGDATPMQRHDDGWFTADLRLWWRAPGGLEPWLSVRNLFDAATVPAVIVNAAAGRFYEPGPGRGLELGIRWAAGR